MPAGRHISYSFLAYDIRVPISKKFVITFSIIVKDENIGPILKTICCISAYRFVKSRGSNVTLLVHERLKERRGRIFGKDRIENLGISNVFAVCLTDPTCINAAIFLLTKIHLSKVILVFFTPLKKLDCMHYLGLDTLTGGISHPA